MTPAANNPTPSKLRRWLRPVASAAAVIALSAATGWGVASLASPAEEPNTAKARAALRGEVPVPPSIATQVAYCVEVSRKIRARSLPVAE